MLEEIGQNTAGAAIEAAVYKALESGKVKSLAAGQMGMSTTEVGDLVASLV
jgi:3-isopropylmalate dehydrogenase